MHPRYIAQRSDNAEKRIQQAARTLAAGSDLDPLIARMETAWHNDFQVSMVLKREALADLMEAVVEAKQPAKKATKAA